MCIRVTIKNTQPNEKWIRGLSFLLHFQKQTLITEMAADTFLLAEVQVPTLLNGLLCLADARYFFFLKGLFAFFFPPN